jgi:hypothetical protein
MAIDSTVYQYFNMCNVFFSNEQHFLCKLVLRDQTNDEEQTQTLLSLEPWGLSWGGILDTPDPLFIVLETIR